MPDSPLRGRRILVVEDEYFLAEALTRALREARADLMGPVASVESGLYLLATGPMPEAASLDVNLGIARVYPLADALLARAVPFVFTTGYDQAMIPGAYAQIRRLGKPIEPPALLKAQGTLLET